MRQPGDVGLPYRLITRRIRGARRRRPLNAETRQGLGISGTAVRFPNDQSCRRPLEQIAGVLSEWSEVLQIAIVSW